MPRKRYCRIVTGFLKHQEAEKRKCAKQRRIHDVVDLKTEESSAIKRKAKRVRKLTLAELCSASETRYFDVIDWELAVQRCEHHFELKAFVNIHSLGFGAWQRSKIREIICCDDVVAVVTFSGLCVFCATESLKSLGSANVSTAEKVKTVFMNKATDDVITVYTKREGTRPRRVRPPMLVRATNLEHVRNGLATAGGNYRDILSTEKIFSPGFIEFDERNSRILTFNNTSREYKVWHLEDYRFLFSFSADPSEGKIEEVKISNGIVFKIFDTRSEHRRVYLPLHLCRAMDGSLLKQLKVDLMDSSEAAYDFLEICGDCLLLHEANESHTPLFVYNILGKKPPHQCRNFRTPVAFLHIYLSTKLLLIQNDRLQILNYITDETKDVEEGEGNSESLGLHISHSHSVVTTFCKVGRSSSYRVNVHSLTNGQHIASVKCASDESVVRCSPVLSKSFAERKSPTHPLSHLCAVFYNELRKEIYSGNREGFLHCWGQVFSDIPASRGAATDDPLSDSPPKPMAEDSFRKMMTSLQ